jgi:NADH-quinone oxidoreductase subunit N
LFRIEKKFWCGSEIFITIFIVGTVVALSRRGWIMVWLGLELNIVGFLGWICIVDRAKYGSVDSWAVFDEISVFPPNSEPFAKYFLVQSVGSAFFLVGPLIYGTYVISGCRPLFLLFGLFIKRGVAPFHQWFPSVCSNVSWKINLALMFWQKVGPIFVIVSVLYSSSVILFLGFRVVSLFFGVFGAIGQTQLRSLFAYSSVAHIGWIVAVIYFSKLAFFYYFVLYRVMVVSLLSVFSSIKVYRLKIIREIVGRVGYVLVGLGLVLRIGGVPPFTGFFIKVYALYVIIWGGWAILAVVFCVFAAMRLSYYINVGFNLLLFCVFPKVALKLEGSMGLGAVSLMGGVLSVIGIFRGLGLCLVRGIIF